MKYAQSKDGTKIAYDAYGDGPALLFITGATCFRNFAPVMHDAETFAQTFTVYNYDRRGRGDSEDAAEYDVQREVEDIEALINEAGGSVYLYGHSSGAILVLEAAMRLDKESIRGITIYDASYAHDAQELGEFKKLTNELEKLIQKKEYSIALERFLLSIGTPDQVVNYMKSSPDWRHMVQLASTLRYDTKLAGELPPINRIRHITLPVQIVVGKESPKSIHEVAAQLQKAMPHAVYEELAGQDHMPGPTFVHEILKQQL